MRPLGFKSYLALSLGGLALLVLLLVGLYGARLATQAALQARADKLLSHARAAAELLGANLRERETEVLILSQAPHLVDGPLDSAAVRHSLALRKRLRSEYAWLGVTDASGRVLAASDDLLIGVSVAARDWFQAATRRGFVGDVHEAKLLAKLLPPAADGEPLRFIDFAAPIVGRDGQLRGVVGTHAHWSWVTRTVVDTVRQYGLPATAEVLILDRQGRVLYPQEQAGSQALETVTPRPRAVQAWRDGIEYLVGQAVVLSGGQSELGWQVLVREPLDSALQPVRALSRQLLLIGLLAALACAALAYGLAVRLSRPLVGLASTVRRIEAGEVDADFPPPQGPAEVRLLDQAVRGMTESLLRKERELETINAGLENTVAARTAALEAANAELARLATRDPLTGVFNRRWFDDRLRDSIQLARRQGSGIALLLLDIDHFKRINDQHGHDAGDAVLREFAALLEAQTRGSDCVARIGGEEFALLMPGTERAEAALHVAAKLKAAVAAALFPAVGRISFSAGVSLWTPDDDDGAQMLKRADEALYRAKAGGRDRCELETR